MRLTWQRLALPLTLLFCVSHNSHEFKPHEQRMSLRDVFSMDPAERPALVVVICVFFRFALRLLLVAASA